MTHKVVKTFDFDDGNDLQVVKGDTRNSPKARCKIGRERLKGPFQFYAIRWSRDSGREVRKYLPVCEEHLLNLESKLTKFYRLVGRAGRTKWDEFPLDDLLQQVGIKPVK